MQGCAHGSSVEAMSNGTFFEGAILFSSIYYIQIYFEMNLL